MKQLFSKISFHLYCILFLCAYHIIFIDYHLAVYINILILGISYYFILFKNKPEFALFLIIYARCLNGFIVPGNPLVISLVIYATSYIPILFLLMRNVSKKGLPLFYQNIYQKKYTSIYILLLFIFSLFNPYLSFPLFFTTILPLVLFIFNPIIFEGEYDCKKIIIFFRYIFIASLSVMAFTDYIIINQELLSGSIVFKQEVINPQLSIVDLVRNQGCFWDSRILGIFSYLYLYLALTNKVKYKAFDILLSIIITVSTLSRGPIVVELFLLAGYLFSQKISLKRVWLIISAVVGTFIIAIQFVDEQIYSFLETFLPTSGGALEQRQGFKDYALNEFYSNPLGSGLGSISSPNVKKVINVGGQIYEKAGDAYLFINLAELGIIGFSLFLLSTVEILYKKKVLSIALLLGFLIQLTGTNVPDMGMYFYVFITLVHSYSFLNTEKIGDEVKAAY